MRLALIMNEQGELTETDLDGGPDSPLKVMQNAVDNGSGNSLIQPVDLTETIAGACMYVNEEGLYAFEEDRVNPFASQFQAQEYGRGYIRGPVIFTGGIDRKGETTGLSVEQSEYIASSIAAFKVYGIGA